VGCRFYQGLQHLTPALCSDELQQETRKWPRPEGGGPPIWYVLDALDELHEQEQQEQSDSDSEWEPQN
jgi:hypothetical protein